MRRTRKTKPVFRGVSTDYLDKLWRRAVRVYWNFTDPLSGHRDVTGQTIECHHIIPRKRYLTRWDYRNGVVLSFENHGKVTDYVLERRKVENLVDMEYLDSISRQTKKDYLITHGLSDAEFRQQKKKELLEIIKSGE